MSSYSIRMLVLIVLLAAVYKSKAQFAKYQYNNDIVENSDSNKLIFNLATSLFIKDNEYFNKITEGYTLTGYWITPSLSWHPSQNSSLEGGFNALKFNGRDRFFSIRPVLSFTQKINKNFRLVIGTLNFNNDHLMPAPLLNPERFYFNRAENGLQFLIDEKYARSDIWFTADSFIWYGDTVQEHFAGGASNEFVILKKESWSVSVPLQLIITHKGGQINRPKKPIETLENIGTGLVLELNPRNSFLKKIRINPHFFLYKQATSAKLRPYQKGWALYPNIYIETKPIYFNFAWWNSSSFISPLGESIYQSVSTIKPENNEKTRNLFIGKLGYSRLLLEGITCSAGFEGYYDTNEKLFDYNFYFHFVFNGKFKLKI